MADKKKKAKAGSGVATSLIGQVARNWRTVLSRNLLDLGLYAGQDGVMLALDKEDGQTPGAIAAALGVRAPTITKTINRLAAQGFLRREDSPSDGRMSHVFLMDEGRQQIKAVRKALRRTEKILLAGVKDKDVRKLVKLLGRMDANLSAAASVPAGAPAEEETAADLAMGPTV